MLKCVNVHKHLKIKYEQNLIQARILLYTSPNKVILGQIINKSFGENLLKRNQELFIVLIT